MKNFVELLEALGTETSLTIPPEGYRNGLAYVAWKLWAIMSSDDTPQPVQLQAIKEIVDRCRGRPGAEQRFAMSSKDEIFERLNLHYLDSDEASLLSELFDRVDPDRYEDE